MTDACSDVVPAARRPRQRVLHGTLATRLDHRVVLRQAVCCLNKPDSLGLDRFNLVTCFFIELELVILQHVRVEEFLEFADGAVILLSLVDTKLLDELLAALLILTRHQLRLALRFGVVFVWRRAVALRSVQATVDVGLATCRDRPDSDRATLWLNLLRTSWVTSAIQLVWAVLAYILFDLLGALDLSAFTIVKF